MEITPDRLIEIALDNLKQKLSSAVSWNEPIQPAALEKLPGAIREAADVLRHKGNHFVRGEDILAEARADLTSRLAGSLKAGVLLPNELSPEIVKWLAGTPLAIQIANLIRPSGRRQMAGGAAAMAAMGPVAILAKPPGDQSGNNGPINIIANPPGDQAGNNGPINIIARPPGDSMGDSGPIGIIVHPPEDTGPIGIIANPPGDRSGNNGPINIIARPPGDESGNSAPIYILAKPPSGGSNGGSQMGHPRLGWLLPIGLSAAVILVLLGLLAGSIGRRNGPAPTETVGFAAGVSKRTFTISPSLTGTPTVAVPSSPTPTVTLTVTSSWTETPTPTMPPASFFEVIVEPKHIYYRGTGCGEQQALFQVKVAEPEKVAGVWLFIRLRDKNGEDATPWGEALVMTPMGSEAYSYLLFSESIPDFTKFREAWVQYQFVAYDSVFAQVSTSEVFWDLDLLVCGM